MNADTAPPVLPTRPTGASHDAPPGSPSWYSQLWRFGVVGIVLNALLFAAYLALVAVGLDPKPAMTLLYVAGVALGFRLNRRWSFGGRGVERDEAIRYAAVCVAGYLLNLAVLMVCVDRLGLRHDAVQAVMVLVVAGMSFVLNRWWVFGAPGGRA